MLDDGRVLADPPQRATPDKAWQVAGFLFGEAEELGGVSHLVRCLLEEDACAGVTEKAGGDFARGGSVGGLGAQVGEAVADEDVADPPMWLSAMKRGVV